MHADYAIPWGKFVLKIELSQIFTLHISLKTNYYCILFLLENARNTTVCLFVCH